MWLSANLSILRYEVLHLRDALMLMPVALLMIMFLEPDTSCIKAVCCMFLLTATGTMSENWKKNDYQCLLFPWYLIVQSLNSRCSFLPVIWSWLSGLLTASVCSPHVVCDLETARSLTGSCDVFGWLSNTSADGWPEWVHVLVKFNKMGNG